MGNTQQKEAPQAPESSQSQASNASLSQVRSQLPAVSHSKAIPTPGSRPIHFESMTPPVFGSPLPSPLNPSDFARNSNLSNVGSVYASSYGGTNQSLASTHSPKAVVPTVLTWSHGGQEVYVAGDFSQWNKIPLTKSHDDFTTVLELPLGDYTFRFWVDGEWKTTSELPTIPDSDGNLTNYLEVFQEGLDDRSISFAQKPDELVFNEADFTRKIPQPDANDKEPHLLPPHLTKIILNSDTISESDPSLLPTPHHVMLNHLYALSIRDGVMVLGSTLRYRQKYVTSVFYKPVVLA